MLKRTAKDLAFNSSSTLGYKPSFSLDFRKLENPVTKYGFVFTRATTATYVNSAGLLATAASGELRYDYDPVTLAPRGILVEEASTNAIRNSVLAGAVVGTPGTLPTNWGAINLPSGLAWALVGTGSEDGITYVDIRVSGTSGATDFVRISMETTTGIAAATGQAWSNAVYVTVVGGAMNTLQGRIGLLERTAGGAYVVDGTATVSFVAGSLIQNRHFYARTLAGGATVGAVVPQVVLSNIGVGTVVDVTLRIGAPQCEQKNFATSYIPTTGAAATRNADALTLTGAAGRTNLITYSQELDNAAWDGAYFKAYGSGSVANATTAPDGLSSAEFVVWQTNANVNHYVRHATSTVTASTVYCFSVYVKAGGYAQVGIRESAATGAWAAFNLDSGGSVIASSGLTAGITSVGNGWFRLSGYLSTGGATSFRYSIYGLDASYTSGSPNTYTFTADGTSGVYLWGAQLETGSSATAYIPTTNGPRTVENVASWFNGDAGTWVAVFRLNSAVAAQRSIVEIADTTTANNRHFLVHSGAAIAQYWRSASGSPVYQPSTQTLAAETTHKFAGTYLVGDQAAVLNAGTVAQATTSALPHSLKTVYVAGTVTSSSLNLNGTIAYLAFYPRRLSNSDLQRLTR